LRGHVIGRLKVSGHRFLANHGDASTLKELASGAKEPIGRGGWVRCMKGTGRNLFSFERGRGYEGQFGSRNSKLC